MTKFLLFLVLFMIGWEDGAKFVDQSQSEVKKKPKAVLNYFSTPLKIPLTNSSMNGEIIPDLTEIEEIVRKEAQTKRVPPV